MNAIELNQKIGSVLDEWEDRPYLGISQIGECPHRLYSDMVNGRETPSQKTRQYCHEGYLHEADVLARLERAGIAVTNRQREVVCPRDARFRGHIDGEIEGNLLEIKSVTPAKFEQVRAERVPLHKHMAQIQMYMRYGEYWHTFVVYKNRENGATWVLAVEYDRDQAEQLELKAGTVLAAIDWGEPPACTCGWCR